MSHREQKGEGTCAMCHFMCHGFAGVQRKSPETGGIARHTDGTRNETGKGVPTELVR